MKIVLIAMAALAVVTAPSYSGMVSMPDSKPLPRVLQDAESKIIVYLETDQSHLSAVGPDGKLLWSVNICPDAINEPLRNVKIEIVGGSVKYSAQGGGYGTISTAFDLKTGKCILIESI